MAVIGQLVAMITANTTGLNSGLNSATRSVDNFSSRANSSFNRLRSTIFSLKNAIFALAGIGGVGVLAKSFISASSAVEQYRIRLRFLLRSSEEASKTFRDMANYAMDVSHTYQDIMEGATRLSGVMRGGSEEIKKWMPLIGDLAAATGFTLKETIGQVIRMYSAGAAAADMFREHGITTMLGFAAKTHYTAEVTRRMLMESWTKTDSQFKGAAYALGKTWDGLMGHFRDRWFNFRNLVMEAGVFDLLKGKVGGILQKINQMLKTGELKEWATVMSTKIVNALEKFERGIKFVYDNFGKLIIVLKVFIAFKLGTAFLSIGSSAIVAAAGITTMSTAMVSFGVAVRAALGVTMIGLKGGLFGLTLFGGYKLGDWLREKFQIVEKFGIALVSGLHRIYLTIKTELAITFQEMLLGATRAYNSAKAMWITTKLAMKGVDITQLVFPAKYPGEAMIEAKIRKIRSDSKKHIQEVDRIYSDMFTNVGKGLDKIKDKFKDVEDAGKKAGEETTNAFAGAGGITGYRTFMERATAIQDMNREFEMQNELVFKIGEGLKWQEKIITNLKPPKDSPLNPEYLIRSALALDDINLSLERLSTHPFHLGLIDLNVQRKAYERLAIDQNKIDEWYFAERKDLVKQHLYDTELMIRDVNELLEFTAVAMEGHIDTAFDNIFIDGMDTFDKLFDNILLDFKRLAGRMVKEAIFKPIVSQMGMGGMFGFPDAQQDFVGPPTRTQMMMQTAAPYIGAGAMGYAAGGLGGGLGAMGGMFLGGPVGAMVGGYVGSAIEEMLDPKKPISFQVMIEEQALIDIQESFSDAVAQGFLDAVRSDDFNQFKLAMGNAMSMSVEDAMKSVFLVMAMKPLEKLFQPMFEKIGLYGMQQTALDIIGPTSLAWTKFAPLVQEPLVTMEDIVSASPTKEEIQTYLDIIKPMIDQVAQMGVDLSDKMGLNTEAIQENTSAILGPVDRFLQSLEFGPLAPVKSFAGLAYTEQKLFTEAMADSSQFQAYASFMTGTQLPNLQMLSPDYQGDVASIRANIEAMPWVMEEREKKLAEEIAKALNPALLGIQEGQATEINVYIGNEAVDTRIIKSFDDPNVIQVVEEKVAPFIPSQGGAYR